MGEPSVAFRPGTPLWRLTTGGIRIRLHVQPRSSRNCLQGVHDGAVRVRVTAAPVDGAANRAVIALLADVFDVPKKAVTIVTGQQGRDKLAEITTDYPQRLVTRLEAALARVDKPQAGD